LLLPWDLRSLGIRPRTVQGLWGILCGPFLHADWGHLLANTGALFILSALAASLSPARALAALAVIVPVSGGLVWALGSGSAVHIGASGVIFGLLGFLIFQGVFRRDLKSILVSLAVLILYGGLFFTLLQTRAGVSWSSHFWGLLSGVRAAWLLRKGDPGREARGG
jgi:membrane associated rhomboid family serine protease